MTTNTAITPTADGVKTTLPAELHETDRPAALATFLGFFSLGLGLWELLSPRTVANSTGVRSETLLRAYGARELAAGLGILTTRRPALWLWARVAGDALDLATLGATIARADSDEDRAKAVTATTAVAGVTALDLMCALAHT